MADFQEINPIHDVDNAVTRLFQKVENPQFLQNEGRVLVTHLEKIARPEVQLSGTRPELFTLGRSATLDLTGLPPDDTALLEHASKAFLSQYKEPKRQMRWEAVRAGSGGCTDVTFQSTPVDVAKGVWNVIMRRRTDTASAALKVRLSHSPHASRLFPIEGLTREEKIAMAIALSNSIRRGGGDNLEDITKASASHAYNDLLFLLEIAENPAQIATIFPLNEMAVLPSRLMTDAEYEKWLSFVATHQKAERKLAYLRSVLKARHYGPSGRRVVLEETVYDGNSLISTHMKLPLEVRNGRRRTGWQIADISSTPRMPIKVHFYHGARDMAPTYTE
jgi:hypothetical protein